MFIKYSTHQIPPKKSRGKGSKGRKTVDDSQETVDVSKESAHEPKLAKKKSLSKRRIKKKVTLLANDNIISDDPDAALELAKSINQIKAEEAEATRKVHATHAKIVTKSVPEFAKKKSSERSYKSVVNQDTLSAPKSEPATSKTKLKDFQEYGRVIPETMLTKGIMQSEAYQTFNKYSTGLIHPKKSKGKGSQGKNRRKSKKKVSILTDDNIILETDVALELGKSISLVEAEEEDDEVAKHVHETHERLVIESNPEPARRSTRRRPSGIAFRDTLSMSKKRSPDQSQKLKGSEEESEYSKEENVDEEIEWLTTDEEEEKKDKDEDDRSINIKKTEDDEESDDEFVHGDEHVQDDVDKEIKDTKVTYTGIDNQEITDAEKAEVEKTKEVKVVNHLISSSTFSSLEYSLSSSEPQLILESPLNSELPFTSSGTPGLVPVPSLEVIKDTKVTYTGIDNQEITDAEKAEVEKTKEVKGDNKKADLPSTSSSLFVSYGFGNQFLTLSSDISLTRTLKDNTDVKINSLLDIQIQQE
nr:hypothetical protein [Tanacetum cinerariifolium]